METKLHLGTAARTEKSEITNAAKGSDSTKLADANKRWFANTDQIANFLSGANPKNWPQAEMRSLMHDHLDLTTKEVVVRLHGDWAGDIAAYDAVHQQILHMTHGLTMGIINQFPKKFE